MTTSKAASGQHRANGATSTNGATAPREDGEDVSEASHGTHHVPHPGKTGSWVAVCLITAAFVLAVLGMILGNVVIDIIAAVFFVGGVILAFVSRIFEQVE
jgi:uncharacterized ion transporter superfamily protein YfcC